MSDQYDYWKVIWKQFRKNRIGVLALSVVLAFFTVGLYAPLLASSKPWVVSWNGRLYFPLLRYLFYPGFYTKPIDLFYNLLMFTLPVGALIFWLSRGKLRKVVITLLAMAQIALFCWILSGAVHDPSSDPALKRARREILDSKISYREDPLLAPIPQEASWAFDLAYMTDYEKLNALLRYKQRKAQHHKLSHYATAYEERTGRILPTLWATEQRKETQIRTQLQELLENSQEDYLQALDYLPKFSSIYQPFSHTFIMAKHRLLNQGDEEAKAEFQTVLEQTKPYRAPLAEARGIIQRYRKAAAELAYLDERNQWYESQSEKLRVRIPALVRSFHWEEDAGGAQAANQFLPWWELTRINRKDLVSSLLFGIRISILVGISAICLSLIIGIPLGLIAGYFGGKIDLLICRIIEIWEAMPTFFMLLLIIAITQSKSIFLVIGVLGIFGWTGICRFLRAEVLKQRNLPYVLACKSMGFRDRKTMFSHILPNAIPPILTLLPFAMMAAITSEAGLSFLGLGEEGSTSWGVLMDEGRSAFPSESYLLWPPAILLTLLLVSIALVGDAMRDAIDPRMRS